MNRILLRIKDGLFLELRNLVEIHGHDDSLPYDGHLIVHDNSDNTFTYIGTVFNDGWGGPTAISPKSPEGKAKMEQIDALLKENFKVKYRGEDAFPCDLEYAVDCMADAFLCHKVGFMKISDIL